MVSKARDDFPEPERPVKTTILLRGISTVMFFKLCVRAPFTMSFSALGLKFVFVAKCDFLVIYTQLHPRMGPRGQCEYFIMMK